MVGVTCSQGRGTEAADHLFCHLEGSGGMAWPARLTEAVAYEPAPPPGEAELPPAVRAAHEWLRREKARLEAYTRAQLARIYAERQQAAGQNYLAEQALILRTQELNRKEEFLARQVRSLQEQAAQLAQREQALLGGLQEQRHGQEEWCAVQKASQDLRHEADGQQALLAALRAETSALQAARDAARADLGALEAALPAQRAALAAEQAALAAYRSQLERRAEALAQEETAMQRRQAEIDDLEARLCQEAEAQERQLVGLR
jgi:hypothetical protein